MDEQQRTSAIYDLRLFNEKAEELHRARLLESLRAGQRSYHTEWSEGEGWSVERNLPHPEEIKAYAATLRLFTLRTEPFSFWRLRSLYPHLDVTDSVKRRAAQVVENVNSYLDAPSTIIMERVQVSRRRVFDVFIYGGLLPAHDRSKKDVMDYWAAHPELHIVLEDEFIEVLLNLTQLNFNMRHVNLDALAELAT
jgi:hypothetical protein